MSDEVGESAPEASAEVSAEAVSAERHVPRRQSRTRALEILYEADLKAQPLSVVLAAHMARTPPPPAHTVAIVRGVHRNRMTIDDLIQSNARDWKLSRMPIVDRNLLRIGLYEILFDVEVPTAVAIDEAVELAKQLSTDDSPRFVNGLLARVAEATATA